MFPTLHTLHPRPIPDKSSLVDIIDSDSASKTSPTERVAKPILENSESKTQQKDHQFTCVRDTKYRVTKRKRDAGPTIENLAESLGHSTYDKKDELKSLFNSIKKHWDVFEKDLYKSAFLLGSSYTKYDEKKKRDLFILSDKHHQYIDTIEVDSHTDSYLILMWDFKLSSWNISSNDSLVGRGSYKIVYKARRLNSTNEESLVKDDSVLCLTNDVDEKKDNGIVFDSIKLLRDTFGKDFPYERHHLASPPERIFQFPSEIDFNEFSEDEEEGIEEEYRNSSPSTPKHIFKRKFYELELPLYLENILKNKNLSKEEALELVIRTIYDQLIAISTLNSKYLVIRDITSDNWFVDKGRVYLGDYDFLSKISNPTFRTCIKDGKEKLYKFNIFGPTATLDLFIYDGEFLDNVFEQFDPEHPLVEELKIEMLKFKELDGERAKKFTNVTTDDLLDIEIYLYDEIQNLLEFIENSSETELENFFQSMGLAHESDTLDFMDTINILKHNYSLYDSKEHLVSEWYKKNYGDLHAVLQNMIQIIEKYYPHFTL